MKRRLTLFGAWLTCEPWRLRVAVLVLSAMLALAAGFVPNGVALAGFASGGSG